MADQNITPKKSSNVGNIGGKIQRSFLGRYFYQSKATQNSILYVFPIILIYQLGILFTGGVQNGVDFVTPKIFSGLALLISSLGYTTYKANVLMAYATLLLVAMLIYILLIYTQHRKNAVNIKIWPLMLVESLLYAFFFGQMVHWLMSFFHLKVTLMAFSLNTAYMPKGISAFVLSFGAGFYEELVFRVFLLSGSVWFLSRKISMSRTVSIFIGVFLSSFVFSAIHHMGSLADPFTFDVFFFRFFAGIVLSSIYATRGFAIVVYTHAFYDVFVMVF